MAAVDTHRGVGIAMVAMALLLTLAVPVRVAPQPAAVTFQVSPTVAPLVANQIESLVARIMEFIRTDLGMTPARTVTVHIFGSRRELLDALIDQFEIPEERARIVVGRSGYLAIGANILIDAGSPTFVDPGGLTDRTGIVAHELAHIFHNDLMGGPAPAPRWLREGFAVRMELRALDHLGLRPVAGAREQLNLTLFAYRRGELIPLAELDDLNGWTRQIQRFGSDRVYAQSFVAVEYLVQTRTLDAVLTYFRAFQESNDAGSNFRAAFGLDIEDFEQEFQQHLASLAR